MVRRLLVGICEPKHERFGVRTAEERGCRLARHSQTPGPGMIEAGDLVEHRLDPDSVVPFDSGDRAGEIRAGNRSRGGRGRIEAELRDQTDVRLTQVGIDLRRKEVVDIGARPVGRLVRGGVTVDDVVGGMRVRREDSARRVGA
jgi:hypothetical protein